MASDLFDWGLVVIGFGAACFTVFELLYYAATGDLHGPMILVTLVIANACLPAFRRVSAAPLRRGGRNVE